jgi:hypothetical protein
VETVPTDLLRQHQAGLSALLPLVKRTTNVFRGSDFALAVYIVLLPPRHAEKNRFVAEATPKTTAPAIHIQTRSHLIFFEKSSSHRYNESTAGVFSP